MLYICAEINCNCMYHRAYVAQTVKGKTGGTPKKVGPKYQKFVKQGNYSLRRPPKLIIPQTIIEQRWATVYRYMCDKICIRKQLYMMRA